MWDEPKCDNLQQTMVTSFPGQHKQFSAFIYLNNLDVGLFSCLPGVCYTETKLHSWDGNVYGIDYSETLESKLSVVALVANNFCPFNGKQFVKALFVVSVQVVDTSCCLACHGTAEQLGIAVVSGAELQLMPHKLGRLCSLGSVVPRGSRICTHCEGLGWPRCFSWPARWCRVQRDCAGLGAAAASD